MTEIIVTILWLCCGIVEASGSLKVILSTISSKISKIHTLYLTIAGSLIFVFAAGVASVVIIMIGVLLMDVYDERSLDRVNPSRTLKIVEPRMGFIMGTSGIYYEIYYVSLGDFFWWALLSMCYLRGIYGMTGIA